MFIVEICFENIDFFKEYDMIMIISRGDNMSGNNSKKNAYEEKKRLEQKKFMLQLEKEITKLERKIRYSRLKNLKIGTIKNLKISARVLQWLAPYALTASIVANGCKLLTGGLPFYRDDTHQYLHIMKEFDNLGNIKTEQQYDEFSNNTNILNYYSRWMKNEDGTYTRNIQTYRLENITEEDITKLFNNEIAISDILEEPLSDVMETKNSLSEEEIKEKDFLQAIIYDINKEEYIVVKESIGANVFISILYIIVVCVCGGILSRLKIPHFDLGICVKEIKEKHPSIDTKELAKKLEIKKSNYNRLTR